MPSKPQNRFGAGKTTPNSNVQPVGKGQGSTAPAGASPSTFNSTPTTRRAR